ncbi:MAG: T9SS type A sorting domain-containing protein, partial [Saprospiraceae bacterium]|nr:T9SS type A sorting domain-containing protein [Saprospiraceae bacterium]
ARITIVGDATDNSTTFTEDMLIDARPRTTASLLWEVAEPWGLWTAHRTPNLGAIVQEIVNRSNWQPGNALSFLLLGENQGPSELENAREFESFENIADPEDGGDGQNHPERVPQLIIYYSGVNSSALAVAIMPTDTITDDGVTFAASSDDAEQENDEIDALFDDDIDAGWEGEPDDQNILTAGLRFRGINIPREAVIDSAYILVFSHEAKTAEDVARITIAAEATDNAQTFTEDMLISDRPRTNASLLWEVAEPWGLWTPHRTPDLSHIVQEVVNREGWQAGNAIAFVLLGENQGPSEVENAREFESFENIADPEDGGDGQNHPERVPQLIIFYTVSDVVSSVSSLAANVKSLSLYPNPASANTVTVELESNEASDIRLYNTQGQLMSILRHDFGQQFDLNINHLPKGIYFVQATQNNQVYIQKLIVE